MNTQILLVLDLFIVGEIRTTRTAAELATVLEDAVPALNATMDILRHTSEVSICHVSYIKIPHTILPLATSPTAAAPKITLASSGMYKSVLGSGLGDASGNGVGGNLGNSVVGKRALVAAEIAVVEATVSAFPAAFDVLDLAVDALTARPRAAAPLFAIVAGESDAHESH